MIVTTPSARDGQMKRSRSSFFENRQAPLGEPHAASVHLGATSQGVIDTAMVLRVKPVLVVMEGRLRAIIAKLEGLTAQFGSRSMVAYTVSGHRAGTATICIDAD